MNVIINYYCFIFQVQSWPNLLQPLSAVTRPSPTSPTTTPRKPRVKSSSKRSSRASTSQSSQSHTDTAGGNTNPAVQVYGYNTTSHPKHTTHPAHPSYPAGTTAPYTSVVQSCVDLSDPRYISPCTCPSTDLSHTYCDGFYVCPRSPRQLHGYGAPATPVRPVSIGPGFAGTNLTISSTGYKSEPFITMDKSILKVHLPTSGFNVVKCGDATDVKVG